MLTEMAGGGVSVCLREEPSEDGAGDTRRRMRLLTGVWKGRFISVTDQNGWRYVTEMRHQDALSCEGVWECHGCGNVLDRWGTQMCECGCDLPNAKRYVQVEIGAGTNMTYLVAERARIWAKGDERVEIAVAMSEVTGRASGMIALVRRGRGVEIGRDVA